MKRSSLSPKAVLVTALIALSGCEKAPEPPAAKAALEVNAENCKPENVAKIPDNDARQAFSSLCARSSRLRPSSSQTW